MEKTPWLCQWEGSIKLAINAPHSRTWFCIAEGSIQGCPMYAVRWHLGHLLTECVCGKQFTVNHALSCSCGGLPSFCHNEIRDRCYSRSSQWGVPQCRHRAWAAAPVRWTAQPQNSQHWREGPPRCERTRVLRRPASVCIFYLWVLNPLAPSNRRLPLPQCFQSH